jgi:alpha-glucosidase
VPFERLQDPYGRRFWPKFKGRDGCRTPLPWDSGPHAASAVPSRGCRSLPRTLALNVAAQDADPDSVLNFARGPSRCARMPRRCMRRHRLRHRIGRRHCARPAALRAARTGCALVCLFNLGEEALPVALPSLEAILLSGAVRRTATQTLLERNGFLIAELQR